MFFDKGVRAVQWRKDCLQQMMLDQLNSHMLKKKPRPNFENLMSFQKLTQNRASLVAQW